jgi:hypothetical protein
MLRISCVLFVSLALTGCSAKTPTSQILNSGANLPLQGLPENPLAWRVVTAGINRQQHIMFTLYGNDLAVDHARVYGQDSYPDGSEIALVTWSQKEDPHWFGGNIPAAPLSVEFVTFRGGNASYTHFSGTPFAANAVDFSTQQLRLQYLTEMKPALMP